MHGVSIEVKGRLRTTILSYKKKEENIWGSSVVMVILKNLNLPLKFLVTRFEVYEKQTERHQVSSSTSKMQK